MAYAGASDGGLGVSLYRGYRGFLGFYKVFGGLGFPKLFPKIRGSSLGVPVTRTLLFWGVYWSLLNLES